MVSIRMCSGIKGIVVLMGSGRKVSCCLPVMLPDMLLTCFGGQGAKRPRRDVRHSSSVRLLLPGRAITTNEVLGLDFNP